MRLPIVTGLTLLFAGTAVLCQSQAQFPLAIDARTMRTQERVEEIYVNGDFERALLIYRQELAPIGDKYAQYMVGYMHLHGQGVTPDRSVALAWYRVAAERGEEILLAARDQLIAVMSPRELGRADALFHDLWQRLGDRKLILDLIAKDMDELRTHTGSRIPDAGGAMPMVIYTPSGQPIGPNYYRDIRARIQARLRYLDSHVEVIDLPLDESNAAMKSREAEIKEELAKLEP